MTFIPSSEFLINVGLGKVPGYSNLNKFGRNGSIATAGEDIWAYGGDYMGHPTNAPETVDFSSTVAADAAGGTGMRTLRFWGLKTATSTSIEYEDIILNGTTKVTSAITWYRVFRIRGATYGTGGTNAGVILAHQTTTTANIFADVQIGKGQTQVCAFTIPYATKGLLVGRSVTMVRANNAAGQAEMALRVRAYGSGGYNCAANAEITNTVGMVGPIETPTAMPALADVKLRAESVSNAGTIVTAMLHILLVQD